ncbi:hypothetical protein EI94DRAFT_1698716 [Lactarius quietus]|nr:hypothetical protein EI94DRAFT_1698716 [Lactarius quietus]
MPLVVVAARVSLSLLCLLLLFCAIMVIAVPILVLCQSCSSPCGTVAFVRLYHHGCHFHHCTVVFQVVFGCVIFVAQTIVVVKGWGGSMGMNMAKENNNSPFGVLGPQANNEPVTMNHGGDEDSTATLVQTAVGI